jgi:hypothetical protein
MKNAAWMQTAALALGLSLAPKAAFAASEADFVKTLTDVKGVVVGEAQSLKAPAPIGGGLIIADRTTTVSVDLNEQTVKCSAADYSAPMLKVLVPALARLTILNHRNTAEGAPCLAAGRCSEAVGPDAILKPGAGAEQIPVRVVLKKVVEVDGAACLVTLIETVTTKIRGTAFFHERRQEVAQRVAADCQ